ncbi:MAG: META domain-containing protein [Muribaculaceae bacterium]|nr:META domain-containing protein [Muribaculaceae bacterium]
MKTSIQLTLIALALVFGSSCTGFKRENSVSNENRSSDVADHANIKGQWMLENIVFNDSDYVQPSEAVPGSRTYITLEDSTYFIRTNCNTISGSYCVKGDSIVLHDGIMTEKACDNMIIEDAIRRILPNITTVNIENDSIARLNSRTPAEYIVLHKTTGRK